MPYLVDSGPGNADLKSSLFHLGLRIFLCLVFVCLFIYETKDLTPEQIDELFETVLSARHSKKFTPSEGLANRSTEVCGSSSINKKAVVEAIEKF